MSNTPRTDAEAIRIDDSDIETCERCFDAMAEFARSLEREHNDCLALLGARKLEVERLKEELDSALKQWRHYADAHEAAEAACNENIRTIARLAESQTFLRRVLAAAVTDAGGVLAIRSAIGFPDGDPKILAHTAPVDGNLHVTIWKKPVDTAPTPLIPSTP
jgi:hypothetical protein